jgi:hypothetical protein
MKDWNVLGWKVDHCYYHETDLSAKCTVRLSKDIMIGVWDLPVDLFQSNGLYSRVLREPLQASRDYLHRLPFRRSREGIVSTDTLGRYIGFIS